jgi:hypothetical protein
MSTHLRSFYEKSEKISRWFRHDAGPAVKLPRLVGVETTLIAGNAAGVRNIATVINVFSEELRAVIHRPLAHP